MGVSLCRRYFSHFCSGNSCSNMHFSHFSSGKSYSNMPACDGRLLHRIPELYELCLPKCLCMSNREGSVDFMRCKPEVLLAAVGSVSELITRVHIQGAGTTEVHVAIMLVVCFVCICGTQQKWRGLFLSVSWY